MRITDLRVTPVAVDDPPLLNSVGIHQPYALRSILELDTDEGITGLSETYGDAAMLRDLASVRPSLIGRDPFDLHLLASAVRGRGTGSGTIIDLAPGTMATRADARLFGALEVAYLDVQGRALGRRVVDLLGGAARERVPFAAYLFYRYAAHVGGPARPDDTMGEVLDAEAVVAQARSFNERYGFRSLKLKGGVLAPADEVEAVLALRDAFPADPIRIDPNAAWTVDTAIEVMRRLDGVIEYLEDPTPGMAGMAQVAARVETPLATNMVVIGFEDLPEAIRTGAVDVVLADHHYWGGLQRSRELARICSTWGLGLSMHSNSHLGISFAAMVHLGAALPELTSAFDTHQPWQTDEVIDGGKLSIVDGSVGLPSGPGLGVELDRDALARLNERYERCGIRERDDRGQMRRYDPEWRGTLPRF